MPNTTDARHQEALRLRNTGLSYGAIARALGYGNYPSAARYAVMAAIRANGSTISNTERQFGIEAEFFGISRDEALIALRAVGINVVSIGYTHEVMPEWKIVSDASVSGEGLELVSPILKGEAGLADVKKALDALHNAGARVNTTCGLHVHVDTNDMSNTQRLNLFDIYTKNQDLMDGLVSPSRRHNRRYTQRYSGSNLAYARDCIRTGRDTGDRFFTVNTVSITKYGTIEFRQHQGTINGEKTCNWVKMLLAMASKATSVVTESSEVYASLADLMDGIGADESTKVYLVRRNAALVRQTVAA